jgi:hypothetical protein
MVCLRGFFDESGKREDPALNEVSLAGYLGTVETWARFNELWGSVLADFSVGYFHMKELRKCQGPFVGWKGQDEKAAAFLAALAAAIGYHHCQR